MLTFQLLFQNDTFCIKMPLINLGSKIEANFSIIAISFLNIVNTCYIIKGTTVVSNEKFGQVVVVWITEFELF